MVLPQRGLTVEFVGRPQAKQPTTRKVGIGACSDSVVQSRQHAPCPHARFGPRPAGADLSVGSSLWPPRRPRHCVRFGFLAWGHGPSIFLRPLARPALPGFTATMGALTPEQAALRRPLALAKRRRSTHEHRLEICSGLPALRDRPSEHSIPNHLTAPAVALTHNPSARQAFWASPRMRRLAGRPCRNGFVLLRTAHSLPVAFHPSSRRRSYFQVQAGVCMPEEDFHLSGQSRSQAHSSLRRQGPIQRFQIGNTMPKAGYVYILASRRNGTLYTGVTHDVARRVWEHKHDLIE